MTATPQNSAGTLRLTVVICAHNPHQGRLARVLAGLAAQSLAASEWETILVDNASSPALETALRPCARPARLRIVGEPALGLTAARRRGVREAAGAVIVFVDDDNVLAADYLSRVLERFDAQPDLGAAGGRSIGEFETEPAAWQREFLPLLALRDLGEAAQVSEPGWAGGTYPAFAPIGAGMAVRRDALATWLRQDGGGMSDRQGRELSSAGDNEIVFSVLRSGWRVAYFPELVLTHLIPAERLAPPYLARLNRGIQMSWMQVLTRNAANPWPPLGGAGAWARKCKAWFTHRPWRSPAARVRWAGACGHFDGRRIIP